MNRVFKVPSPAVALKRREVYTNLRTSLRQSTASLDIASQRSVLSAFDSAPFVNQQGLPLRADVLLPCATSLEAVGLLEELLAGGHETPKDVLDGILSRSAKATDEISSMTEEASFDDLRNVVVEKQPNKSWKVTFGETSALSVTSSRILWLRDAHTRMTRKERSAYAEGRFNVRLYCLLQRYETLAGLGGGGAGNQAAIPADVVAVFENWAKARVGTAVEGYASALNHRRVTTLPTAAWPLFGTAFEDVDGCFGGGSVGLDGLKGFRAPARPKQRRRQQNRNQREPALSEDEEDELFPQEAAAGGTETPTAAAAAADGDNETAVAASEEEAAAAAAAAADPAAFDEAARLARELERQVEHLDAPKHRLLVVNPPFAPYALSRLPFAIDEALKGDVNTTALVVVPFEAGRLDADSPHYKALSERALAVAHLRPNQHAYVDGNSHRPYSDPPQKPQFSTALFAISNRPKASAEKAEFLLKIVSSAWGEALAKAGKQWEKRSLAYGAGESDSKKKSHSSDTNGDEANPKKPKLGRDKRYTTRTAAVTRHENKSKLVGGEQKEFKGDFNIVKPARRPNAAP